MGGVSDMFGDIISGGFGLAGGLLGAGQNRQSQRAGYDFQREVLQNSIQWRMQDAAKAGVHPLAAMGMMPASSSPVVLGETYSEPFAKAGQSFGRAVSATDSSIEDQQLKLLKAQTNNINAQTAEIMRPKQPGLVGIQPENVGGGVLPAGSTPAMPQDRVPEPDTSGLITVTPPQRMTTGAAGKGIESGISPDLEMIDTGTGFKYLAPSTRGQESHHEVISELKPWQELSLMLRNQAYWSSHGYSNWWNDALRVAAGYKPDGPIATTHSGMIPPSAYGALQGAFKMLQKAGPRVFDYATNEASAYMNRYKKWSQSHQSGRR